MASPWDRQWPKSTVQGKSIRPLLKLRQTCGISNCFIFDQDFKFIVEIYKSFRKILQIILKTFFNNSLRMFWFWKVNTDLFSLELVNSELLSVVETSWFEPIISSFSMTPKTVLMSPPVVIYLLVIRNWTIQVISTKQSYFYHQD